MQDQALYYYIIKQEFLQAKDHCHEPPLKRGIGRKHINAFTLF